MIFEKYLDVDEQNELAHKAIDKDYYFYMDRKDGSGSYARPFWCAYPYEKAEIVDAIMSGHPQFSTDNTRIKIKVRVNEESYKPCITSIDNILIPYEELEELQRKANGVDDE